MHWSVQPGLVSVCESPGGGGITWGVSTVYLDYNATTPLDPAVLRDMEPFLGEVYGNPSSVHHIGRRSRAALDDARDRLATLLALQTE